MDAQQQEVLLSLGRIEGMLSEMKVGQLDNKTSLASLAERVSAIERWQSYLKGAWAFGALCFVYIINKLHFGVTIRGQ